MSDSQYLGNIESDLQCLELKAVHLDDSINKLETEGAKTHNES